MARKNKVAGEKAPMAKWKKWLIALAVLALIAIAIVLIVVFLPKNTNDVKKEVLAQNENAFLVGDIDQKLYNNFQQKINADAMEFSQTVNNVKIVATNINDTLAFYAEHIVFAQDNRVFQSQYYTILDNFNVANSYQNTIFSILTEVEEKVDNYSATYLTTAWGQLKVAFEGYLNAYAASFEGLGEVFASCLGQGVISNEFSALVVKTLPLFFRTLASDLNANSAVVSKLNSFVSAYIRNENSPIYSYNYSVSLQATTKQLNKFGEIYNVSFQDVIKTATSTDFTFEKLESDSADCLSVVKSFLKGGLSA